MALEVINDFDARGMHRVYGRGDRFGRFTLNMDIWQARSGLLFVRFWSRSDDVDWESYQILGFPGARLRRHEMCGENEHWVPECLRREYER